MMRPSELLLPYDRWKALGKPSDADDLEWFGAWEAYDLAVSPMDDEARRQRRLGHYMGWFDRGQTS